MKAWTDYPIAALGDAYGVEAPVRECIILDYDGNKYCRVRVGTCVAEFKRFYLYTKPGRIGEVPEVTHAEAMAARHKAQARRRRQAARGGQVEPRFDALRFRSPRRP